MLPIDVTFDTGEETKGERKRKKTSLKIIIVVKQDIIEVQRTIRFCGTDFHRSIALNEIICLPVFVLTCGLYKFFWVAYLVL